jgi:hypothetical protein
MNDLNGVKAETANPNNKAIETLPQEKSAGEDYAPIPPEVLKELPPQQQEQIKRFVSQSVSLFSGQFPNPLLQKVTSEHISDVIKNADETDKRDRTERGSERKHNIIILSIALFCTLFLVVFLVIYNQLELLKYFISAILGFAGGFGVGKYRKED